MGDRGTRCVGAAMAPGLRSHNLAAVESIAAQGLAVTVVKSGTFPPRLRALSGRDGMPRLPGADMRLHRARVCRGLLGCWGTTSFRPLRSDCKPETFNQGPVPQAGRETAARRPALPAGLEALHVAPSRSTETAPRPCGRGPPRARASYPVGEARHRCTNRCPFRGRPTEALRVGRGVFEEIRRALGVFSGGYRRATPGYSLGSHFCASFLGLCTNLVKRHKCS